MQKTITVGQAIALYQECNKIAGKELPGLLAYKVSRVQKAVSPIVETFDEQRKAIMQNTEEADTAQQEQLRAILLEEEEVSLPVIPMKLLTQTDLTVRFFNVFEDLIEQE